ncbi:MAG: calcium/sodium antiporter [Candidatus Hydrothermarchaeales archaeon]
MLNPLIILIIGLLVLLKGSDYFIEAAAYIARYFGIAELIIGLTIVSMGTSLPELGVSVYASYGGSGGIAVGNVVGSNIANIALVLGLIIIFTSIKTDEKMLKRDGYFMLGASFLFAAMVFLGNHISRVDGVILMLLFIFYLRLLYKQRSEGVVTGIDSDPEGDNGVMRALLKLVGGGMAVFVGARLLVTSALSIAYMIGVSEGVIGSTLVAFGTSLPELVVSVTAIKKGYTHISIGNIIGSNIFNILWVLGLASLVSPLAANDVLMWFNIPMMLVVAALLVIFMKFGSELDRKEGLLFVALYLFFLVVNFW